MDSLPVSMLYLIFPYIPCYGLTAEILLGHRRRMRASRLLHKIAGLDTTEKLVISRDMKTHDFYKEPLYEFDGDTLYLRIQSEAQPVRNWEYMVTYYV